MKRTPVQLNSINCPDELVSYLKDSTVFDSSCSAEANVLYIDRDEGYYLKIAKETALRTESLMTEYMHSLGLSAEVLYYDSYDGKDYLLTRRISGEDCTDSGYLSNPERLCETTAVLLRKLHETDGKNCPIQDRNSTYIDAVLRGIERKQFEPDLF